MYCLDFVNGTISTEFFFRLNPGGSCQLLQAFMRCKPGSEMANLRMCCRLDSSKKLCSRLKNSLKKKN